MSIIKIKPKLASSRDTRESIVASRDKAELAAVKTLIENLSSENQKALTALLNRMEKKP
jgi:hypothetical protein